MRRPIYPERVRNAATLLPFAASALLLPPFILVFAVPVAVVGIPLIVVYVFGCWAMIVACTWLLARRLSAPGGSDGSDDVDDETEPTLVSDRR